MRATNSETPFIPNYHRQVPLPDQTKRSTSPDKPPISSENPDTDQEAAEKKQKEADAAWPAWICHSSHHVNAGRISPDEKCAFFPHQACVTRCDDVVVIEVEHFADGWVCWDCQLHYIGGPDGQLVCNG
jgi:hypothetical protein